MIKNIFYVTFYIILMIVIFALLVVNPYLFYSKTEEIYEHRYDCCDQENEGFKRKAKDALEDSSTKLTNGLKTILKDFQTRIKKRLLWPANDVIIEIKKQIGLFELTTKNNDYSLKIAELRGKSADFETLIDKLITSLPPGSCMNTIIEHENKLRIQNRIVKMEKMVKIVHKNTNEITSKIDIMEDDLEKKAAEQLRNVDIAKENIERNIGAIQNRISESLSLLQKSSINPDLDPRKFDKYKTYRVIFYGASTLAIIFFIFHIISIASVRAKHLTEEWLTAFIQGLAFSFMFLLIFAFVVAKLIGPNEETRMYCTENTDESLLKNFYIQFIDERSHINHNYIGSTCASSSDTFFKQLPIKDAISTNITIRTIDFDKFIDQLVARVRSQKLEAISLQKEFSKETKDIESLIEILDKLLENNCRNDAQQSEISKYRDEYKQFVKYSRDYQNSVVKFDENIGKYAVISRDYLDKSFKDIRLPIESSINEVYKHINSADFNCQSIIRPPNTCPRSPELDHLSLYFNFLFGICIFSAICQVLPIPWYTYSNLKESDAPNEPKNDNTFDLCSTQSSITLCTAVEENESSSSVSRSRTGLDVESACISEQPVQRGAKNLWMHAAMNNDPDCSISSESSGYDNDNTMMENENRVEDCIREES